MIETLGRPGAATLDRSGDGARALIPSRNRPDVAPRLEIFEAAPGSVDFVPAETIAPATWAPTWYVLGVAMDGDSVAFQPDRRFATNNEISTSERSTAGWTTASASPSPHVSIAVNP